MGNRSDGQRPIARCCERGCDQPVDRTQSRVRCAEHYTQPVYDGSNRYQPTAKRKKTP